MSITQETMRDFINNKNKNKSDSRVRSINPFTAVAIASSLIDVPIRVWMQSTLIGHNFQKTRDT